jgi:transcriptional regulator GlxA family with amidase domain
MDRTYSRIDHPAAPAPAPRGSTAERRAIGALRRHLPKELRGVPSTLVPAHRGTKHQQEIIDATGPVTQGEVVRHRSVVIVVFDGVQGLDVFGPADVFYFANHRAAEVGHDQLPYSVEIAAGSPGRVRTAAGPAIYADREVRDPRLQPDVLLIAGGLCVGDAAADETFVRDLTALTGRSGEVGSICSGALLLAETGLLDGRHATTHWAMADVLATTHPEVIVEPDRIHVHDGVWTSAGVTAGIDLALQLVRNHHGNDLATEAARNMVVYLQRAGGQQQFSTHLAAQRSSNPSIADLMAHIADHPDADLSIAALADHVNMSERSLQRIFTAEVGTSPGKYVERVRVDTARALLEQTDDGLSAIADRCGFASTETCIRAFKRVVGVNPTEYRQRFATLGP